MTKLRRNMLPPARLPAIPEHAQGLDPCTRVSKVSFQVVFPPRTDGLCRCGCGEELGTLRPAHQWASPTCTAGAVYVYWLWKGDVRVIRTALWRRDKGRCALCGQQPTASTLAGRQSAWDAHHQVAVEDGGGRLGIDNFQTLCQPCHAKHHHGHPAANVRAEHRKRTAAEKARRKAARPANWRARAAAKRHSRR